MKKLVTTIGMFAILAICTSFTSSNTISDVNLNEAATLVAPCTTPTGELQGQINQLEAQGYVVTDILCNPIFYFVQPDPPYLNGTIHVTMRKIDCFGNPDGPCALLSTAHIQADEIVQNSQGTLLQTNVTVGIAL
jgi:hypothetical protein